MTPTTPLDAARRLAEPVGRLGGGFMLDPEVLGAGKAAGYPNGFVYYVIGRGGVLGDVAADVVSSAFGFFAPSLVATMWSGGIEPARAGADRYTEGCQQWGRSRLSGFDGATRLADLLARVIDAADASGLSLFAGWRAQPRPNDDVARCYQLVHVLRELRGCVHLIAVLATGLTPLEAIIANPNGGAAAAVRFGWNGEMPVARPDDFARAEELTNRLMARHLGILDSAELDDLVRLATEANERAFRPERPS
ncbi:MAG: SCO6745 family protein [Actinomycetota bacterium]